MQDRAMARPRATRPEPGGEPAVVPGSRHAELSALSAALNARAAQRMPAPPTRAGLPDRPKAGVEALSGLPMDEARRLVQQAQGRIEPALQRKDGAQAAGALPAPSRMDGRRLRPSGVRPPIQRSKESAELLTKLSVPQIKPGPSIEAQKELVERMDSDKNLEGDILNLGGILIDALPEDKDLLTSAKLVALPTSGGFISTGKPRGKEIIEKGLDRLVVENTLKTMLDAGQIEYLRLAGLPNEDWKILVEVHYYRARDMSQTGFHKDTLGETLFVNLNYHMNRSVVGPEYVLNPPPSPQHDEQTQSTLPPVFREDLAHGRETLGEPTEYGAGVAEPYAYVAFVDEAIHHATPYYHHRYVTGADLEEHLQTRYPAELKEAKKALVGMQSGWNVFGYGFASYVDKGIIAEKETAKWETWMRLVENRQGRLTRNDLSETMEDDEFDEMLAQTGDKLDGPRTKGGASGFQQASIPKSPSSPINPGKPALKRRLSNAEFRKTLPPEPPENEKRAFFRTWVRVVPEEKAAKLRI